MNVGELCGLRLCTVTVVRLCGPTCWYVGLHLYLVNVGELCGPTDRRVWLQQYLVIIDEVCRQNYLCWATYVLGNYW